MILIPNRRKHFGGVGIDPSTLSPYLDINAADLTGYSDGDDISSLTESSSNGFGFTNTYGAGSVLYKTNQFNGKPCIRFVSGALKESTGSKTLFKFLHDGSDHTIFVVSRINAADPAALYAFLGTEAYSSAERGFFLAYNDVPANNNRLIYLVSRGVSGQSPINLNMDDAYTTETSHIIATRHKADVAEDDHIINVDNSLAGSADPSYAYNALNSTDELWIGSGGGGAYLFVGDQARVIIFDKDLTDDEFNGVNQFLANDLGVSV